MLKVKADRNEVIRSVVGSWEGENVALLIYSTKNKKENKKANKV